jgi:hypothetical protein
MEKPSDDEELFSLEQCVPASLLEGTHPEGTQIKLVDPNDEL